METVEAEILILIALTYARGKGEERPSHLHSSSAQAKERLSVTFFTFSEIKSGTKES